MADVATAPPPEPTTVPADGEAPARRPLVLRTPALGGPFVGFVFWLQSLRPTLLTHPPLSQGVVGGLCLLIGYGIGGLVIGVALRVNHRIGWAGVSPTVRTSARWAFLVVAAVGVVGGSVAWLAWLAWQNDQRTQVTMPHVSWTELSVMLLVVVVVLAGALAATRYTHRRCPGPRLRGHDVLRGPGGIPFGTVVLEELAFRGTLLGLLRRRRPVPWAVGVMSVLFGLWHVKGGTARRRRRDRGGSGGRHGGGHHRAGVGFGWLRVRSDSLEAPVLTHIATNSVTFAAAWAFWH